MRKLWIVLHGCGNILWRNDGTLNIHQIKHVQTPIKHAQTPINHVQSPITPVQTPINVLNSCACNDYATLKYDTSLTHMESLIMSQHWSCDCVLPLTVSQHQSSGMVFRPSHNNTNQRWSFTQGLPIAHLFSACLSRRVGRFTCRHACKHSIIRLGDTQLYMYVMYTM